MEVLGVLQTLDLCRETPDLLLLETQTRRLISEAGGRRRRKKHQPALQQQTKQALIQAGGSPQFEELQTRMQINVNKIYSSVFVAFPSDIRRSRVNVLLRRRDQKDTKFIVNHLPNLL